MARDGMQKDELPAYDGVGRPPGYIEMDARDVRARLQVMSSIPAPAGGDLEGGFRRQGERVMTSDGLEGDASRYGERGPGLVNVGGRVDSGRVPGANTESFPPPSFY